MENLGLIIKNEKVIVSSKDVAEVYGKRHDHVIRDIRNIVKSVPQAQPNFGETTYLDSQRREQPCYVMDRQGFSMLVTGFTGNKAKQFTYKYTLAFEEMSKELEKPKKLSPMEQLKLQYEVLDDHDSRIKRLEGSMTIDFGQQKVLGDLARQKAVQALGGFDSPAYKNKSIRTKVFSRVWKDFKDYFEVNSYRNTPKKDFEKAKDHIKNWQVQGKLLKEIEETNNQLRLAVAR